MHKYSSIAHKKIVFAYIALILLNLIAEAYLLPFYLKYAHGFHLFPAEHGIPAIIE